MREFYELINEYPWTTFLLVVILFYIVSIISWGLKKGN